MTELAGGVGSRLSICDRCLGSTRLVAALANPVTHIHALRHYTATEP